MSSFVSAVRLSDRHLPPLDGLRGVAILLVIFIHTLILQATSPSVLDRIWLHVVMGGWMSVDLFFVLSGFLITGILYDAKGSAHYFKNFYARRFLRILPLYYGFLLVFCVVAPRVASLGYAVPGDYARWPLSFWLYTANFSMMGAETIKSPELVVFWTLAVEEQFYLTWPFLVWMFSRERLIKLCAALIVLACLVRLALVWYGAGVLSMIMFTPGRMDTLAAGALVALLVRGPEAAVVLGRRSRAIAACTAIGIIAAVAVSAGNLGNWSTLERAWGYSGVAIMWASVVATVVMEPSGIIARVLSIRPLQRVGQFSYGMYVFHMVVVLWLTPIFFRTAPRVLPTFSMQLPLQLAYHATVITATVMIGWLTWHAYEKQFLKLKVYFRRHEPARSTEEIARLPAVDVSAG
jgi:peptidoglycan/LPS O-acetylase OafA/YrhL